MAADRIGKLPPRYILGINPYRETRFSKCPKCERPTYPRKFPLLIYVKQAESGPLVLGKTCKYCSKCEFIIVHQDELESTLAAAFAEREPAALGNDYFIIGTVEKKIWKQSLENPETPYQDILARTADIKKYVELIYEPARWVPSDEPDP